MGSDLGNYRDYLGTEDNGLWNVIFEDVQLAPSSSAYLDTVYRG